VLVQEGVIRMSSVMRFAILIAVVYSAAVPFQSSDTSVFTVFAAEDQTDVKKEFDAVCADTYNATTLGDEELKSLIARCDALKPRIEKLEESHRRVMLKRLSMCRELYNYVLQSNKEGKKQP
jgi:hypothetical protein